MSLQFYDSLTQSKRVFVPICPGEVGLYVCGMTVSDYCHIGHARLLIVFDMLTRYLRFSGFKVTYVRNITDVDDKIIQRAHENSEAYTVLIERFIRALHADEEALGVLPPDHEPRATHSIADMLTLIEILLAKGFAYFTDQGDICFRVRQFDSYGKLSHRELDDLMPGARVQIKGHKDDPLDFVLWKAAKAGEPAWSSPWGEGRPGWHIECSAMSTRLLGQPFDLHGGGLDLKFPHHENEIAQSEAASETVLAHYWLHCGLLTVNGEKMSKSLHNFVTIRDALKSYSVEVIRYFFLSSHYRSPINYSSENVVLARQALVTLYTALRDLPDVREAGTEMFHMQFNHAMDDDCNTPAAFAVFFDMAHVINRLRTQGEMVQAAAIAAGLKKLASIFGILQQDPRHYLQSGHVVRSEVEQLIKQRHIARADKNWQEADRIRLALNRMGVVIQDDAQGVTTWHVC